MAKPTIITRAGKGSALTWTEGDTNLTNLRDATITVTDGTNSKALNLNDTLTFTAGTNISISVNSSTGAVTVTGTKSGTVTSVGGTGTVSGISLSGTVTSSGNLTLGGSLDLSSPPAIGATAPSTAAFTTVSATTTTTSGAVNVTYNPSATSGSAIQISGKDSQGGVGYIDFLKVTNTTSGATNANKTFRTTSTGQLEVINSAYSQTIFSLTDAGFLTCLGANIAGALTIKDLRETVYTSGSTTGTITPDVANGTVQKITLTGNITFNAFANPVAGQSMTLIITNSSGGGLTLTSTMKFSGASKTLSTGANAIDIITVFYDGSTYYASLAKGFA